ncbi:hypothetical protein Cantr_04364 [Candida viswanathii]|uniref:Thioesterase domain-containing protein n=1 Tax=Candida viswanathii TaxID=5486 RepID=A0A367XQI8_9ASCO|nr:hypothetical protein Cantr_04364 [Candida viswanathii]
MTAPPTLVNSPDISFEARLQSNPRYVRLQDEYAAFTATHTQKLSINEKLTPNFTGVTLVGDNKINLRTPTMYFIEDRFLSGFGDIPESYEGANYSVTFFHLGQGLTSHLGVLHGGITATLGDELTCRLAFLNFESRRGVTANLNIDYRQPALADQFMMVKCKVLEKKGRKCWVRGEVYKVPEGNVDGEEDVRIDRPENLLAQCKVLVIEPKWVDKLA